MGPDTWGQLVEAGYRLSDRTLYLRSPAFRGDDVRALQRMLNALGFDAGKEDGIFGPRTDRAVREFQRNVASRVDGIVGLDTVHAISRYRPPVDAPSRAVVREGEAARGPGLALSGSVIAIEPDRVDEDAADVSLAIARELSEALIHLGARPLLLREGTEVPPVDERIRRANAGDAAALISIAVGTGEQVERVGLLPLRNADHTFPHGSPAGRVDPARARSAARASRCRPAPEVDRDPARDADAGGAHRACGGDRP